MKQRFKRTVFWNKYISEITTQPKNNNFDYMIDPTFKNFNRLFVFSFKNIDTDAVRDSFDKCYMSLAEIEDFNVLIKNKYFFDQSRKSTQGGYEKLVGMSRNDDYTTENLLHCSYHQNCYILIGTDLSREANASIPRKINFVGKLETYDEATTFFLVKKQQKTILNFSLDSFNVTL